MNNIILDENLLWIAGAFFVLVVYVSYSVYQYQKYSYLRVKGFWFSRTNPKTFSRTRLWPISWQGHLFSVTSFLLLYAVYLIERRFTFRTGILFFILICISALVSNKKASF
jgi:hypothetical protein